MFGEEFAVFHNKISFPNFKPSIDRSLFVKLQLKRFGFAGNLPSNSAMPQSALTAAKSFPGDSQGAKAVLRVGRNLLNSAGFEKEKEY
jgi:hypothetical protein